MAAMIPKPPICTEMYEVHCIDKVSIMDARESVYDCVDCLGTSTLGSEVATLSRLRYKHRNQLRQWKGLARLKQIERCVKVLNCTEFSRQLSQLFDMIPGRISSTMERIYLPSAPLIEYVRMRLSIAIAILQKATGYCLSAYQLMSQQLSECLFVKAMTILAAAISRVWILCQFISEKLASCSRKLRTLLLSLNPDISPNSLENEQPEVEADDTLPLMTANCDEVSINMQDAVVYAPQSLVENLVATSEVIDRNWFNSNTENAIKTVITPSTVKFVPLLPVRCKSPLIRRVAKFLASSESSAAGLQASPPKVQSPLRCLSAEESQSLRESVQACSNVSQLYRVLAKMNRLRPDTGLHSMKRCLAQLKQLKMRRRHWSEERSVRRRNNAELLQVGQAIVDKFIARNRAAEVFGNHNMNESCISDEPDSVPNANSTQHSDKQPQANSANTYDDEASVGGWPNVSDNIMLVTCNDDVGHKALKRKNSKRTGNEASNGEQFADGVANCKLPSLPKLRIVKFLSKKFATYGVTYLSKLRHQLVRSDGMLRCGKNEVRILRRRSLVKVVNCVDTVCRDVKKQDEKGMKWMSRIFEQALTDAKAVQTESMLN